MNLRTPTLVQIIIVLLVFTACKDKKEPDEITEGTVKVSAKAHWQDQPLVIGSTYNDHMDRPLRVEFFKAYISDVYLIAENDSEILLTDIDLIDFSEPWSIEHVVPAGRYKAIRFGIGVPESRNADQDPAQYPNAHPLSVQSSQGMFWTWSSGYIFVSFEGKTSIEGDEENMLDPFGFHVGTDVFYRDFELSKTIEVGENRSEINLVFDADKFLHGADDSIDLEHDYITHTMSDMQLAMRFITLFSDAVRVE